jgi:hypothetical protein
MNGGHRPHLDLARFGGGAEPEGMERFFCGNSTVGTGEKLKRHVLVRASKTLAIFHCDV